MKKILSIILSIAMVFAMFPAMGINAFAEPESQPICVGSRTVCLGNGTYRMWIDGKDTGVYTFKSVSGGYTIQDPETGKYVGLDNGDVLMMSTSTVWSKNCNGLSATTKSSSSLFGWFKKSFCKTTITYLGANEKGQLLASSKCVCVCFTEDFAYDEHSYKYTSNEDGTHSAVCSACKDETAEDDCTYGNGGCCIYCGYLDPDFADVIDIKVCMTAPCKDHWTLCGWRWFYVCLGKKYIVKLTPVAVGTTVELVEYSFDGVNYTAGNSFTTEEKPDTFYIRVTDENGKVTYWKYDNSEVTPADESDLWWDYDNLGSAATAGNGSVGVTSITFSKNVPAGYDEATWKTWATPANSTAYFNPDTGDLTYALNEGEKFIFNYSNLFRAVPSKISDEKKELGLDNYKFGVAASYDNQNKVTISGLELLDVSGVTDFSDMFAYLLCESIDVSSFDVSNGKNFSKMFRNCEKLTTLSLNSWNTANATDMSSMFSKCKVLGTLTFGNNFATANVTDMNHMFYDCNYLSALNFSTFTTANVTDMSYMFHNCQALSALDLQYFDTSNVENMTRMFSNCKSLTALNLSSFNTSKVNNMSYMFYYCQMMTTLTLGKNFTTANVESMVHMFRGCKEVTELDVSTFDTSKVTNMTYMFYECGKMTTLKLGDNFITENVTNMSYMFGGCNCLGTLTLGEKFTTANVTDMTCMFHSCQALSSLDLQYFDTSNVENMTRMFSNCKSLTALNLSSFNTSKVNNMSYMFYYCQMMTTLTLGKNFTTANVESMVHMFRGCKEVTELDVSTFDTSKVTDMTYMFYECGKMTTLKLGDNFITANVTNMSYMFGGCNCLGTLTLGEKFTTANVTDMTYMFHSCQAFSSLDLQYFDTSNVENMAYMFNSCINLAEIIVGADWTVANATSSTNMFKGCAKLPGFNSGSVDKTKAVSTGLGGYLTVVAD